jgi:serine/threonine protein kinase
VTRYELLDRIGVGGMAEIFRGKAVAAGGFEKPVAIKRILPHLSQDRRFVELLIAEAKVLSLLKHRNIVQIFDVGLGDDGQYFLVMEYVDGKDLRAVQTGIEVRRRRMPFDLALHIGAEVCEALEHAHTAKAPDGKQMSLVHRDVSPSNVLLSRAGEIKLTDFGIAKRAEQDVTGHGAVRGKFAYISPEQARNEPLDPRSDVFSVGVLLWEMITNRRLFSGLGDLEALRAVREAKVPRPMEVDRTLAPEIDQLLMAALSRDVKNRPTAGQFGAKLRSIRYSLEVTVGDPASELAKIIDTADEVQRQSAQMLAQHLPSAGHSMSGFEGSEPSEHTIIRIRTADDFATRDKDGAAVAKARMVIDRFEEEETRQAQLSGDQLKVLRGGRRDSQEIEPPKPPRLPGVSAERPAPIRNRRPTDEPTTTRPPIQVDDINAHYDSEESTRLVAPRDRRTPAPERVALPQRPATQPPPMPNNARVRQQTPPPSAFTSPGTVHERAGVPGLPPRNEPQGWPPSAVPSPRGQADDSTIDEQPSVSMTPQPPQLPPPPMPGAGMMTRPQQPGMQPMPQPGMQPMPQPGMQPGILPMPQPGMQPMPQPGRPQQPGMQMQQPGMQQMPQPGMQQMPQPGMQQMPQPGMQQPGMQSPFPPTPQPNGPPSNAGYPAWGVQPQLPPRGASPTTQDVYDQQRPVYPQRPSVPVMGFEKPKREASIKSWVLIVGALIMAGLAFAITRALLAS